MEKNKFTHGSLFSGIGGPEIAAEEMGWKNMFHCEINPFGRKILDYWFPNSKSYEDITKTNFTEWRGKINVLTGGFPCQPFSCAGQRKGAEDDRYLWPEMLRAIREIQPDWVVGENVAGILSMEHPMKAAARTKDRTGTKLNNLSSGAAFGLLPTPMASDATTGAIIGKNDQFVTTRNGTPRRINQNGQNGCVGLARMVRLLPTPNAREADKYSKKYNPNSQMGTALTAMAVNGMLPTPAARDYQPSVSPQALKRKNGKMRTDALCNLPVMLGEHHSQNGGKTSQLNPLFVAEMMGFPPDWTVLPFQSGGRNR